MLPKTCQFENTPRLIHTLSLTMIKLAALGANLAIFSVVIDAKKKGESCRLDLPGLDTYPSGTVWECDSRIADNGQWTLYKQGWPYKHNDVCRIATALSFDKNGMETGCIGTMTCKNGVWISKKPTSTFCPKFCDPKEVPQPKSGGHFECHDDYKSCQLKSWEGHTCKTSVNCNGKNGKWKGKTRCRFLAGNEEESNPPARPNGEWTCNGKCRFTCNDGRKAGSGKLGRTGKWVTSRDWYFCCAEQVKENAFFCLNGQVGLSGVCPEDSNANYSFCNQCDAGFDLSNETLDVCVLRSCSCQNGEAKTGVFCKGHGENACDSCWAGFDMVDGRCEGEGLTTVATTEATTEATTQATTEATTKPTTEPTTEPTTQATPEPTNAPTTESTAPPAESTTHASPSNPTVTRAPGTCDFPFAESCEWVKTETISGPSWDKICSCDNCAEGYKHRKNTCTMYLCACDNGTPVYGKQNVWPWQTCNGNGKERCSGCDEGFEMKKAKFKNVWRCDESVEE